MCTSHSVFKKEKKRKDLYVIWCGKRRLSTTNTDNRSNPAVMKQILIV